MLICLNHFVNICRLRFVRWYNLRFRTRIFTFPFGKHKFSALCSLATGRSRYDSL